MEQASFEIMVHAKCLLAGEHAILRNHPAVVAPVRSKVFILKYYDGHDKLLVDHIHTKYGENLLLIFESLLNYTFKKFNLDLEKLRGHFVIENHIPIACGMGFSAAVCLALANWLAWQKIITKRAIFTTAKLLENLFHGKSSGVDIAGVATNYPIVFQKNKVIQVIKPNWQPKLYLSFSNVTSNTKNCVAHVEELWRLDRSLAAAIDENMQTAVDKIIAALGAPEAAGLRNMIDAFNIATNCFARWGLLNPVLQNHMDYLLNHNAVAAKPTGSGGGGYVLSLWQNEPPADLLPKLLLLSMND